MPFTVVTLKNSPSALRGDLSKWMQEIAVGVYVGNFNSKIRERLWQRIRETVGNGEATISYACRNEIGYDFVTYKTNRQAVDWEGIPLVLIPCEADNVTTMRYGFSKAAKFRKAKRFSSTSRTVEQQAPQTTYIVLDIETDGLNPEENEIIEIGMIKVCGQSEEEYQCLVAYNKQLPMPIVRLTGIDDVMLQSEGRPIEEALAETQRFIGEYPLIGYNVGFDIRFLNAAMKRNGLPAIGNRAHDVKKYVKRDKPLLHNYKLQTVVDAYQIGTHVQHRALFDCRTINELAHKVNGFLKKVNENA